MTYKNDRLWGEVLVQQSSNKAYLLYLLGKALLFSLWNFLGAKQQFWFSNSPCYKISANIRMLQVNTQRWSSHASSFSSLFQYKSLCSYFKSISQSECLNLWTGHLTFADFDSFKNNSANKQPPFSSDQALAALVFWPPNHMEECICSK